MRTAGILRLFTVAVLAAGSARAVAAQEAAPATRQALIESEQAKKAAELTPVRPGQGRSGVHQDRYGPGGGACRTGIRIFQSAYSGGGFTLGAGYAKPCQRVQLHRRPRQLYGRQLQAAEVAFTAPRLFNRRPRCGLLGGWREATQVGFYGLGTDYAERRPHKLRLPAAVCLGAVHVLPDAERCDAARRRGADAVVAGARQGLASRPSKRVYSPDTLPGLGRRHQLRPHRRAPWHSTGVRRPAIRAAAAFTVSPCTTTPTGTSSSASTRSTTKRFSTFRSCARPGCISLHGGASTASRRTVRRFRSSCCRRVGGGSTLRGIPAGASATATACCLQADWRIMVNRFFDTAVFYDAGKVAAQHSGPRLQRYEERLRLRRPFPRAVRPRRFASSWRRSHEGLALVFASSPIF